MQKEVQSFIDDIDKNGLVKLSKKIENPILQLLGNVYFWITIVSVGGLAYWFGNTVVISKYDKEKMELQESKQRLEKQLQDSRKTIDSLLKAIK